MTVEEKLSHMAKKLQASESKLERLQKMLQAEKQSKADLLNDYEHIVNIMETVTN